MGPPRLPVWTSANESLSLREAREVQPLFLEMPAKACSIEQPPTKAN